MCTAIGYGYDIGSPVRLLLHKVMDEGVLRRGIERIVKGAKYIQFRRGHNLDCQRWCPR
jgi:hypothetical protein